MAEDRDRTSELSRIALDSDFISELRASVDFPVQCGDDSPFGRAWPRGPQNVTVRPPTLFNDEQTIISSSAVVKGF